MKIVKFQAENVKRLKAVEIRPDGHLQVIAGNNAQGKSSILDAIWWALGGRKAMQGTQQPIRHGAETASVSLDLGDIKVTRTWSHTAPSKLTVTSQHGAVFKSPQTMLDKLVGELSFDPVAFTRLKPSEQRDALLSFVKLDVDLPALEAERQALYDERTQLGQRSRAMGKIEINEELPANTTPASTILEQIRAAERTTRARVTDRQNLERSQLRVQHLTEKIAQLQEELAETKAAAAAQEKRIAEAQAEEAPDVAALEEQLHDLEEHNTRVTENNQARARLGEQQDLDAAYASRTEQIDQLDNRTAQALAAAEFPVEGLGFGEGGVTYNGVPFKQASSAEQLRVSLAMAIASNPDLRVLRIADGSLLDAQSRELIRQQLEHSDYQLWLEVVGTDEGEGAVIIEDGEVSE